MPAWRAAHWQWRARALSLRPSPSFEPASQDVISCSTESRSPTPSEFRTARTPQGDMAITLYIDRISTFATLHSLPVICSLLVLIVSEIGSESPTPS